mgnify:CR=1 FL=1
MEDLRRTPLHDLHASLGAKMVPFAGWDMPVQYPMGVLNEHLHTRAAAGLFDVSHMGQVILRGENAAKALETLVPADIEGLSPGRQRYGLFTNESGGILDDLMIANKGDHLFLVVNAACADQDIEHLRKLEALGISVEPVTDRALLALQGPKAVEAFARIVPGVADLNPTMRQLVLFEGDGVDSISLFKGVEGHIDQGRGDVFDGGAALVEGAGGDQPVDQLLRHHLAGLGVDGEFAKDFRAFQPVFVKLGGEFDEIARHRRA